MNFVTWLGAGTATSRLNESPVMTALLVVAPARRWTSCHHAGSVIMVTT